jgi:cholesterol transport system auxiliary component
MSRLLHAAWALACGVLPLAACVSVELGNESGQHSQYRLADLAAPSAHAERTVPRSLVVAALPSNGIGDTFSLAYSRSPQQRSLYQYASWAERPSSRIVHLLVRRIDARNAFASVAELGHGVGGELRLNVTVDELVHDTAAAVGRLQVTAELVDRTGRTLVARRRFEAAAPVSQENAAGAVDALSRALTGVLDQLVPWVEASAGRPPATAAR